MPRPLLAGFIALFVCACSEDAAGPASAPAGANDGVRWVDLAPSGETARAVAKQILRPPVGIAPWVVEADRGFLSKVEVGRECAHLPSYTAAGSTQSAEALVVLDKSTVSNRVRIRGSLNPFNRARLLMRVPEDEVVTLVALSKGRELARSEAQPVAATELPRLVPFELPHPSGAGATPDELTLEIGGASQGLMLLEVELEAAAPRDLLAATQGLVALDDSEMQRRGVVLEAGGTLAGQVTAGGFRELVLAIGAPRSFAPARGTHVAVDVATRQGRSVVQSSIPCPEPGEWAEAALDVSALEAGSFDVRVSMSGDAGAGTACVVAATRLRSPQATPRTVLLITSDTHRGDHLGVLDGALVRTPALDALAARGVLFEDAAAASNTTNPSHASLLTAVHVRDTGVVDNHSPLVDSATTLAELFRDAGFRTFAAVSVKHLSPVESGFGQGFERFSAPIDVERDARSTVDVMTRWLGEADGEPVFAWLHVFDAHSPYEPPPELDRRYYPEGKDPKDPKLPFNYPLTFLPRYLEGLRDVTFPHAQYRAEIDFVDGALARLLSLPRVTDGIVLFTADHGESFGQHGVYWDHAELYPDSTHVPLILAWPGSLRGERVGSLVRQIDAGRTLLNLAGLGSVPFEGRDLRAGIEGEDVAARYAISGYGFSASIEREGWLLILHLRDHHPPSVVDARARHSVELYDRRSDPQCENDVAHEETARARDMRSALVQWLGESSGTLAEKGELSPERRARLAALGYMGDDGEGLEGQWIDPACGCGRCAAFR